MPTTLIERLRVEISGAVQGVGFRPFVYRLARECGLSGWVRNDGRGVVIEVEGAVEEVEAFARELERRHPAHAELHRVERSWLEPLGLTGFEIRASDARATKTVAVLPDISTCDRCFGEVVDPDDRRFRYPFTNCTDCGPRFSIVEAIPYDRPNTTMHDFVLCQRCREEYEDPGDRRFHAQPNACPECGPRLELRDPRGRRLGVGDAALRAAARAVRRGDVVAVKGVGGFHLVVLAADDTAVEHLRRRKGRYEKPLALMARDLEQARRLAEIPPAAAALLESPGAPIVLLPKVTSARVADGVAPANPTLGVMLAYTPLHRLLLDEIGEAVVATSGNLSDEPIATDNDEALERLQGIADLFLLHDRPIARHVDDSVFHLLDGLPQPLRRARGWAPLPVPAPTELPSILAVGAHLKNTVALSVGDRVFVSQHVGDMETPQAVAAFERVVADSLALYEAQPVAIARDLHPDYRSSRWCERPAAEPLAGLPVLSVQHHHAHLAACLADNGETESALGVTWDGTGYGTDSTVWGGEFLYGDAAEFERVAALRPFLLLGGDAAVREPRRVALALLWGLYGDAALERRDLAPIASFEERELAPLARMLESGFGSPTTTSAGRLFDGVASLLGLHQRVGFEGQAAMALEFAADAADRDAYALPLRSGPARSPVPLELDWRPLIARIVDETRCGVPAAVIAGRFHRGLAEAIVDVAHVHGSSRVALTGGCFQNRMLSETAAARLRDAGFQVLMHRRLPPNDGSISFGQVMVAAARLERGPP